MKKQCALLAVMPGGYCRKRMYNECKRDKMPCGFTGLMKSNVDAGNRILRTSTASDTHTNNNPIHTITRDDQGFQNITPRTLYAIKDSKTECHAHFTRSWTTKSKWHEHVSQSKTAKKYAPKTKRDQRLNISMQRLTFVITDIETLINEPRHQNNKTALNLKLPKSKRNRLIFHSIMHISTSKPSFSRSMSSYT